MRADIEACMKPGDAGKKAREAFAKKYNVPLSKVNEGAPSAPPAGNGGWVRSAAEWVCRLEVTTSMAIGAAIWDYRRGWDGYKGNDSIDYCIDYSMACDHYNWQQDCLKKRRPDCCY